MTPILVTHQNVVARIYRAVIRDLGKDAAGCALGDELVERVRTYADDNGLEWNEIDGETIYDYAFANLP